MTFSNDASGAMATYRIGETTSVWLTIGIEIPVVVIHVDGVSNGGITLKQDYYVSLIDDAIVKRVDLCPTTGPQGCTNLREEDWRFRGSPWGFGSSLFQGLTLGRDTVVERNATVQGKAAVVRISTVSLDEESGRRVARVKADTSPAGDWTTTIAYPVAGEFVVTENNPYVLSAKTTFPTWKPDSTDLVWFSSEVRQKDFKPGTGPLLPWRERKPPIDFPCFSTEGGLQRGLPPGLDYYLSEFQSNFKEFADYLVANVPKYAEQSVAERFFVAFLEMANGTRIAMADGLVEEREIRVKVRFHDDASTTDWLSVTKTFENPNPLGLPPEFAHRDEGSHPTSLPRDAPMLTPVPFTKVYSWHKKSISDPIQVVSIEAVPGPLVVQERPVEAYYQYGFWSKTSENTLSPAFYDARTGCLATKFYTA